MYTQLVTVVTPQQEVESTSSRAIGVSGAQAGIGLCLVLLSIWYIYTWNQTSGTTVSWAGWTALAVFIAMTIGGVVQLVGALQRNYTGALWNLASASFVWFVVIAFGFACAVAFSFNQKTCDDDYKSNYHSNHDSNWCGCNSFFGFIALTSVGVCMGCAACALMVAVRYRRAASQPNSGMVTVPATTLTMQPMMYEMQMQQQPLYGVPPQGQMVPVQQVPLQQYAVQQYPVQQQYVVGQNFQTL